MVNPLSGTVDLDFRLDVSLVRSWFPEAEVEGLVSGEGSLAYRDDSFTAEGTYDSASLQWAELEPWAAKGRIALADGQLSLDETILRGYGGRVDVEARMDLGEEATQSFRVDYSGLSTIRFIEELFPGFPPLSASMEGHAFVELRDWRLEPGEWSASAVAVPENAPDTLPIGGTIKATGFGNRSEIEADLESEPLRAEMAVRGRVGTDRIDVTIEQRLDRLEETLAWLTDRDLLPEALPDLSGSLRASGKVGGTLDEPSWTAAFESGGLQIGERPYALDALLTGDRHAGQIENLTLLGSRERVEARGAFPLSEQSEWDLEVTASDMPSTNIGRDLDIDLPGVLGGEGRVTGRASDPDWSFTLQHHSENLLSDGAGEAELSVWKEKRAAGFMARASAGDASVDGSGSYSLDAETIEARLVLANLSLGGLLSTVTEMEGLAGSLSGELEAHGTLESPGLRASLTVQDGAVREHEMDPFHLNLTSDGAEIDLSLDLGDERLARGQVLLESPYPLQAEIDLSKFPFTTIVQGLTDLKTELAMEGKLDLNMALSRPENLRYRAFIEEYRAVLPQMVQRASDFTIEGDLRALSIRDFSSVAEDRSLSLAGVIPLESEGSFDFDLAGDLDLSVLAPLLQDAELDGRASVQMKIGGTLSRPELTGTVEIDANAGRWSVVEWEEIIVRVRGERRRLFIDTATMRALGGLVSLQGETPIRDTESGHLTFSLQEVDLGRLFSNPDGEASLVVHADGSLDVDEPSIGGLRGSGRITSVVAGFGKEQVHSSESVSWRFEQGAFSTDPLRIVGGSTDFTTEIGPVRLGDELSWQAILRGKADLSILSPFLVSVPGMQVAGATNLDFRLEGGPDGFLAEGRGTVSGGRLVIPQPPIVLTDLQGTLTIDAAGVRLGDLSARVGDGRVAGEGRIDLTDREQPALDFEIRAEDVPLQLAEGLRGRLSGTLQLVGREDFKLSGRLRLDRGIFDRGLGEEDRLMSEPMVIYGSGTEESFFDRVTLGVDVETVSDLRVENSLAHLEAGANISLTGTLENPVVNGIVALRSDGWFNIGRNRITITTGRVVFEDYPNETPRIQLSAFTRVSSTTIRLDLEGTTADLQTRLTAPDDPDLSEGDLTSLLVTGRTLENAAEGGSQIASTWMMSSMANLLHEGWGDLFTFGPPPGAGPLSLGEEANPTSRLTLGRGITDRLSLTYSIALDQTESQLWILDYRVARNLWIQSIQENGNEYTVGFTHRFSIGEKRAETVGPDTEARVISGVYYQTELTDKVAELSKQVKSKAGDTYDYWAVSEDARRIREALVRQGYRSAVVEVGTSPDEEHLALTFHIEAGPPLEIVWEGDDPGGELKKKIEGAWNGRVPVEFMVPDLAARATWELRAARYYAARVEGRVEPSQETRRVIFRAVLGRQGRRVSLTFSGNQNLGDAVLTAALPETRSPEFFALLAKPDELTKGLHLRYASEGFLDVSAQLGETSFDPGSGILNVLINVDEGAITRISDLQFDGAGAFPIEALRRAVEVEVEVGQPIDVEAIRAAQSDLRTYYRDSGFPDAVVKSRLTRNPEGIEVVFHVDEGAQARVGNVSIAGTSRVKESIIRDQLTFREGDRLRISALNRSMQNLYDSGVFRSADVRVEMESSENEVKDVVVQVAERSGFDMSYGVRYNFVPEGQTEGNLEAKVPGLEGVIRANVANPWGYGSTLGVYAFVQDGRRLFRGYDRFPFFLGRRLPTDLVVEVEDDRSLPGFSLEQWNFTFQQTKRLLDNKYSIQWNIRFGSFHHQGVIGEDARPFDIEEFRAQLGTSLIFDRRDNKAHPTRGQFWNLTVQVAPSFLGSETDYYRFFGQLFNFRPLFGNVVWASSYRIGLAQGRDEEVVLLYEDRFRAGGANSVRGFAQNSLGPTVIVPTVDEEVYIGGQAVVVMNQELRFPIWKDLHGAVFYDLGNVFPGVKDMRFSELRHTAGGGLRYTLPFGAIRLDWARILDVRTGEQPSRFHFGFGYAF
jgi:outer membrane protein assembly complex protein YaeT